eukprot:tig00022075_g23603.t1
MASDGELGLLERVAAKIRSLFGMSEQRGTSGADVEDPEKQGPFARVRAAVTKMIEGAVAKMRELAGGEGRSRYLWILLGLTVFFLVRVGMNMIFGSSAMPEMSYSEFIRRVEAGDVQQALISANQIQIVVKKGLPDQPRVFVTAPVQLDLELPKILRKHGVEFGAPLPDQNPWIATLLNLVLPPLIYFGAWYFMSKKLGGGPAGAMSVGKSKARLLLEGNTGVTFEDVAGVDEAKEELQEIVEFLQNPAKYTRIGAQIPRGVLLVGPAGTGKTLLARAVAGEAGVPFFNISASEFVELFVGVGAARVRDLFAQAKKQAPCIIFIDELDALGKTRSDVGISGGNDEREQTLNQLLTEMDGFESNRGIIVLAATNRPEVLDPALRRPGRFDRQVVVDRPDRQGRLAILQVHAKRLNLAEEVDLQQVAARTTGFAGADLGNLLNEAALLAARKGLDIVRMGDIGEALERVVAGIEKKSRVLSDQEKRIVAYHESGHALVGAVMPSVGRIEKISVVPRGTSALGYTIQFAEEDRFLMAEDEVRGRIATFLGGRSAEEEVFDRVTTGAADDIQGATDMAERAVTLYGMSKRMGPIALQRAAGSQFLEGSSSRRAFGGGAAAQADEEVRALIESAHFLARKTLSMNRALLEEVAQQLMKKEVLEGEELHALLDRVQPPPELAHWLKEGVLPAPAA